MRRSTPAFASCLLASLLATLACSVDLGLSPATQMPLPTYTPYPTPTPYPTSTPETVATRKPSPTSTRPPLSSCVEPESITASDKGKIIEVCCPVVDEGERECPDCPYGGYSYVTCRGGLNIISYDWNFFDMGLCVRIKDKVELMGGKPAFVMGNSEGYAGAECSRDSKGELTCSEGYFQQCNW